MSKFVGKLNLKLTIVAFVEDLICGAKNQTNRFIDISISLGCFLLKTRKNYKSLMIIYKKTLEKFQNNLELKVAGVGDRGQGVRVQGPRKFLPTKVILGRKKGI